MLLFDEDVATKGYAFNFSTIRVFDNFTNAYYPGTLLWTGDAILSPATPTAVALPMSPAFFLSLAFLAPFSKLVRVQSAALGQLSFMNMGFDVVQYVDKNFVTVSPQLVTNRFGNVTLNPPFMLPLGCVLVRKLDMVCICIVLYC